MFPQKMVDAPVAIEYALVSLVESLPKINTTSRRKHRPNSIASSLFRLHGIENRLQIIANRCFCSQDSFVSRISAQKDIRAVT
jgi:hypothetical protein